MSTWGFRIGSMPYFFIFYIAVNTDSSVGDRLKSGLMVVSDRLSMYYDTTIYTYFTPDSAMSLNTGSASE